MRSSTVQTPNHLLLPLLILATLLPLFLPTASALALGAFPPTTPAPLPQVPLPPPPRSPPQPAGDGSGPWHALKPSIGDYGTWVKYYGIALGAQLKSMPNAARNMEHYLENTGSDQIVIIDDMLNTLPAFSAAVRTLLTAQAKAAYRRAAKRARPAAEAFVSPWTLYSYGKGQFNSDWYYAVGAFSYAVAGVVTVAQDRVTLLYTVYVFDRYNWDGNKSTPINTPLGTVVVRDAELGRLHQVGLAREYQVRGYKIPRTFFKYDPNAPLPDWIQSF